MTSRKIRNALINPPVPNPASTARLATPSLPSSDPVRVHALHQTPDYVAWRSHNIAENQEASRRKARQEDRYRRKQREQLRAWKEDIDKESIRRDKLRKMKDDQYKEYCHELSATLGKANSQKAAAWAEKRKKRLQEGQALRASVNKHFNCPLKRDVLNYTFKGT